MKQQIKAIILTFKEKFVIQWRKIGEIAKFMDSRRVSIYRNIKLDRRQKEDIDRLYKEHYGKKIPYTWHRHYTAFTGNFDKNYFPELLYIPEFEYYMTPHLEYCYAFADKNVISMIATCVGVKTPNVILSRTAGIYRDTAGNPLTKEQASNIFLGGGALRLLNPLSILAAV